MAYSFKRAPRLVEEINLEDEEGNVVRTLAIDLDIDAVTARYNRAEAELIQAERLLQEDPKAVNYEQYGQAFVNLLGVIFEPADVTTIVDFYEGRYLEMLTAILPWIMDVVKPQLRKRADEKLAQVKKLQAQQAKAAK